MWWPAALVLSSMLGAACGGGQTSTPAAPAEKAAVCNAKTVKIAVAVTPPNVVHIPPFVANELGYFKEENLTVELPKFEGGVQAFRAVAGGSVDLAQTSSEPFLSAVAEGGDVKAIWTYAPNVDVSFAVGPNVKSPADLKGKKIGVQEPNGFADVMSRLVLKNYGISPNDVTFVQTTTAGRVTQLVAGNTDTAVLHIDQVKTAQKQAPQLRVLVNLWEILKDYEYSVYAASVDGLKSDPNTYECMIRALMKADRAMYDPSMRQKILDIAVKYTKEDPQVVADTFDELVKAKAWPQNEGIPRANIEGTIKSLKDNKTLTKDVTFDQAVDLRLAKKVTAQLGKKDFPY
jgi:ABC-type nitrate/sulfonate/bicarbonate transport system substrate-binding protein